MRIASAWYFAVRDTATFLKKNRRAFLSALLFVTAGILVGILISIGIEDAEYQSYLNLIMVNLYSPFGVFFKMAFFSAMCVLVCYIYMAGRWARIIPYILVFYCGFLIGRASMLDIIICKIVGLISFFLFVLPCYLVLVIAILLFLLHMRKRAFCGLNGLFVKHNLIALKRGLLCLLFALSVQFFLLVVLAGGIKLILYI